MKLQEFNNIIAKAETICAGSGTRLTDKRKRILEILLRSQSPLSAYEVADSYNKTFTSNMPAMSVYRILDFLEAELLVHKLCSTNKYVACSHIACDHNHHISQFLICGQCQNVKEIATSKTVVSELNMQVDSAGYKLMNSQLELRGLCNRCLETAS